MVFWGVEVKSQEPITLKPNEPTNVLRRLHLSQATLGLGKATDKSTLQCTVGYKSPVLLCVLTPDKFESCKLNIEFDEDDDVVFSVIGTRSIHVTGYFLDRTSCCSGSNQNDVEKSESYGEDIGVSDMEKDRGKDDYDYNDSFINDNNDSFKGISSFDNNQIKDISSKRLREQLQGGTSARAADAFVEDSLNNDQKIPLPSKVKLGNVNLDKTSETRTHSQNALVKMFNKYARKDKPLVDNEKNSESLKNEKLSSGVLPSQNGDLTPLMKKRKMERIVETTNIVQEKLFEAQAIINKNTEAMVSETASNEVIIQNTAK